MPASVMWALYTITERSVSEPRLCETHLLHRVQVLAAASGNVGSPCLPVPRWRTLRHITASPGKIGDIACAALVLTRFEHGYIT
jgi:hypothetical protein